MSNCSMRAASRLVDVPCTGTETHSKENATNHPKLMYGIGPMQKL